MEKDWALALGQSGCRGIRGLPGGTPTSNQEERSVRLLERGSAAEVQRSLRVRGNL